MLNDHNDLTSADPFAPRTPRPLSDRATGVRSLNAGPSPANTLHAEIDAILKTLLEIGVEAGSLDGSLFKGVGPADPISGVPVPNGALRDKLSAANKIATLILGSLKKLNEQAGA